METLIDNIFNRKGGGPLVEASLDTPSDRTATYEALQDLLVELDPEMSNAYLDDPQLFHGLSETLQRAMIQCSVEDINLAVVDLGTDDTFVEAGGFYGVWRA